MDSKYRHYLAIFAGLVAVVVWGYLVSQYQPTFDKFAPGFIFIFVIIFTNLFGISIGGGTVSLLPMITLAAFFVMGEVPTATTVLISAYLHQVIRQSFPERLHVRPSASRLVAAAVASANAAIQMFSVLAGGLVYRWLGHTPPLLEVTSTNFLALVIVGLTYLACNLILAGVYIAARGRRILKAYLHSLPNLILYEAVPLIFAPLVALIFTRLGWGWFVVFAVIIVIFSLSIWSLSLTSQRLERRVQELNSLQAVGQVLSSNLRLADILDTIHAEVSRLMPVENFYIAFYYQDADEVTFPLAYESQQLVQWQSRRAGNGLTEYVLRTRQPLLIAREVDQQLANIGIEQVGRPAASWLGVPILSGDEPLGVIAVQSDSTPGAFDRSHCEILMTIAAQAAVAIQNARLYEQTDEALTRRVQELDSILRTAVEGILLLSLDGRILAGNRALASFLGLAQTELSGADFSEHTLVEDERLLGLIGYSAESLDGDCQLLQAGEAVLRQKVVKVLGPPERFLERSLTPVHNLDGAINGWLLVFRDLTEELELARLRDDLTHMLVHDLRTPLTSLKGSLWVMKQELQGAQGHIPEMLDMSERSVERMVGMVKSLLDIAKLETGQMPLNLEWTSLSVLLGEVHERLAGLARDASIQLAVNAEEGLPRLRVDPEQLRRVLINLVDNAIKFTPDGGQVRLWARAATGLEKAMVEVGVTDTGPGISTDAQARLFQKFQQVPQTEGRRRGTGLGLAYCKLVVEAHGGQIWVDSKPGQGASFIMRLPVNPN